MLVVSVHALYKMASTTRATMLSTVSWPMVLKVSMSDSDNVELEVDMSEGQIRGRSVPRA